MTHPVHETYSREFNSGPQANEFDLGAHHIDRGYIPTKRLACVECGVVKRVPMSARKSEYRCPACRTT